MTNKAISEMVIMAVGDVKVERPDPLSLFAHVRPILSRGDITMGNLEGSLCDRGEPIPGKVEIGSKCIRSAPASAQVLPAAGFKAMALANNHNMDYGPEGLLQTIELLDKLKIAHAGGGRNLEESHQPAILLHNETKVAILSYTSVYLHAGYAAGENKPGLATVKIHTAYQAPENVLYQPGFPAITITTPDPDASERMLEDVRLAKKAADIVVVNMHWGVSWNYGRVVGYQKELGRAAVDAGADLIVGHHPHRLLGMEMYKGKLICYSVGNFAFERPIRPSHFGTDTVIVKCYVRNKRVSRFSLIPARINDDWQPYTIDPRKEPDFVKSLEAMSEEFGTAFTVEGEEITINGPKPGTPEPKRGLSILADSVLPLPYIRNKKT